MKAKIRVSIMFKPEITDAHGSAIQKSLQAAGFEGVEDVRSGKVIELEIDVRRRRDAKPLAERMCKELLAHAVSEVYTYTIEF